MRGWCVAHMCSAVELILSRNTVRTCGARCAPETRHHGISWRKLFSLVPGAKHCFLQIRVPNIKCGESWHDQNKHGRDPLQNDVLPLVVGLTCVFLQWSEMYGSSDQSVHNYGSRTTTFIDCARHFVRTLTHAFEAQALTDEMYGARMCFARAPLSAQSTEHCENDLSPLVLMNFEILVVCFEPTRDLRLRIAPGVHGQQLTCAAGHQIPRGLGPTTRTLEKSARQQGHEHNVARPTTTLVRCTLCVLPTLSSALVSPVELQKQNWSNAKTRTVDFQCVCSSAPQRTS